MKIKDKKRFIYAVCTLLFAVLIFIVFIYSHETRMLFSGIGMLFISVISFWIAFSKNKFDEIETSTDERDTYIIRKTAQTSMKAINCILFFMAMLFLLLYGIFKTATFMTIGVTLMITDIAVFAVVLIINCYYEKHE